METVFENLRLWSEEADSSFVGGLAENPGMSLPYVRVVNYLSPSSLDLLEKNPVEFYLRRCGPEEACPPSEEQGFPAAVGSAFDALVKTTLAGVLGLACPPLEKLLENVKTDRDRAIRVGGELLAQYSRSGALKVLLKERPLGLEISPDARRAPMTDVPIKGHLDATVRLRGGRGPGAIVVHDWKVTGANRPGQYSPHPGYKHLWDTKEPGVDQGAHDRAGEPLENLNEKWATQVAMYGWMVGKPLRTTRVSIDELVIGKDGRLRVAQFRTVVTRAFQVKVLERLDSGWRRIQEEAVVDPEVAEAGLELVKVMR